MLSTLHPYDSRALAVDQPMQIKDNIAWRKNLDRRTLMTREDIMDLLRENKESLERFGVRRLALFGSRAREDAQPGSDLDFIVEFEKKSFDAYMDLKFFLEELFGASVDLVLTNTIKPRLRDRILEEAVDVQGL